MKQYDSVYIATRKMVFGELLELDGCGLEEVEGPVIVLTLEELRILWRAAMHNGVRPYDTESFEDYLENRGVKILPTI